MACAACTRLLGKDTVDAQPPDPAFPMNFAGVASRSAVTKQFSQPKVCSFCGSVYCVPRLKLEPRVYQSRAEGK